MLPVRAENELFDPRARILVFQGPTTMRTTRKLLQMLEEPRFTELDANLAHFEQIYRSALEQKEGRDAFASLWGDRYRRVRRRYVALIESELAEVQAMQGAVGAEKNRDDPARTGL